MRILLQAVQIAGDGLTNVDDSLRPRLCLADAVGKGRNRRHNVANLLLARAVRQSRETAVRLALGISRRCLLAQFATKGLLMGTLGGVAALLLAAWSDAAVSSPGELRQAGVGGTRTAARSRSVNLGYDPDALVYTETRFVPGTTREERRLIRHDLLAQLSSHHVERYGNSRGRSSRAFPALAC